MPNAGCVEIVDGNAEKNVAFKVVWPTFVRSIIMGKRISGSWKFATINRVKLMGCF
jgi:hypothetical protein